jgi:rubrerythrin
MERFSIREVVEQAVRTERLGYEFYTAIAKRFEKNDGLKRLFETLANKELVHEKMFLELRAMMGGEEPEAWADVSEYMRAIVESEFFLGREKSLPSLDHLKTVEDAVRFAMGFEKETLLYFYGLRDAVQEKDVVDEIINEEKSHIMWLAKFKDSFIK